MTARIVSGTKTIPASAVAIFAVLADPAQHAAIDGSGMVRGAVASDVPPLSLGAEFAMKMHAGAPYRIVNTVVECEPPSLIAWEVHPGGRLRTLRNAFLGGHRWRYRLRETPEGTVVEEEFDYSNSQAPWLLRLLGFPARNAKAIERTLDRLEQRFVR